MQLATERLEPTWAFNWKFQCETVELSQVCALFASLLTLLSCQWNKHLKQHDRGLRLDNRTILWPQWLSLMSGDGSWRVVNDNDDGLWWWRILYYVDNANGDFPLTGEQALDCKQTKLCTERARCNIFLGQLSQASFWCSGQVSDSVPATAFDIQHGFSKLSFQNSAVDAFFHSNSTLEIQKGLRKYDQKTVWLLVGREYCKVLPCQMSILPLLVETMEPVKLCTYTSTFRDRVQF